MFSSMMILFYSTHDTSHLSFWNCSIVRLRLHCHN